MLILQRKRNESLIINDNIKITILETGNDKVKLAIEAPRSVSVARSELLEAAANNKEAASGDMQAVSNLKKMLDRKTKQ